MCDYLRAIWSCRYFWLSLVKMDLRARYRRSVIGIGWSLMHPLALTLILCLFFSGIVRSDQVGEYAPYLLAGLALWNYVVTVTTQGSQCFFQGEGYIRQYPTPLAIYPLRTALAGTIHFFMALAMAIALACYFKGFENLPYLLFLIPAILMLFVLVWSFALLAGFCNVYFQDTQHLLEVGFQLVFYMSPIIYFEENLPEKLRWLLDWNPVVPFLHVIRAPILQAQAPPLAALVSAMLITTSALGAAVCTLVCLRKKLIFQL